MADALGLQDLNPGERELWLMEDRGAVEVDLDGVEIPFRLNKAGAAMMRDWLDAFIGGGNPGQASLVAPAPDVERPAEGETPGGPAPEIPAELAALEGPHRMPFAAKSETSRRAAQAAYPGFGTRKLAIVHELAEAGDWGRTRDELAKRLDVSPNTVRPRVAELIEGGWVEVGRSVIGGEMTRKTETGADAEVLVLTAAAVEQVNRGE